MDVRSARVVVCEDNLTIRHLLKLNLDEIGFSNIYDFENPILAQEHLNVSSTDLVITDHNMSEMSGIEFIVLLRKTGYKGPIILLSADIKDWMRKKALENRVTCMEKPYNFEDLQTVIWDF